MALMSTAPATVSSNISAHPCLKAMPMSQHEVSQALQQIFQRMYSSGPTCNMFIEELKHFASHNYTQAEQIVEIFVKQYQHIFVSHPNNVNCA